MIQIFKTNNRGTPPQLIDFPWNLVMNEDVNSIIRDKLNTQSVFILIYDKIRESNRKAGFEKFGLIHIDLSAELSRKRSTDMSVPDIHPFYFFRSEENEKVVMPCHKNDHFFLLFFDLNSGQVIYADSNSSFFFASKMVHNISHQLRMRCCEIKHLNPPQITLQKDGVSCGVHTIINCEKLCEENLSGLGEDISVQVERKRLHKHLNTLLEGNPIEEADYEELGQRGGRGDQKAVLEKPNEGRHSASRARQGVKTMMDVTKQSKMQSDKSGDPMEQDEYEELGQRGGRGDQKAALEKPNEGRHSASRARQGVKTMMDVTKQSKMQSDKSGDPMEQDEYEELGQRGGRGDQKAVLEKPNEGRHSASRARQGVKTMMDVTKQSKMQSDKSGDPMEQDEYEELGQRGGRGDQKAVLEKPNEGRHSASRARQGVKTMMDVTKQSKMQSDKSGDPMEQDEYEELGQRGGRGDQKAALEKPNEGRHSASRARQGVKTMMDVTKQSKMQSDKSGDPMEQDEYEELGQRGGRGDQKAVLEKPNEGRHSASRARQGVKTMMDVTKQSKMQSDKSGDPMEQDEYEELGQRGGRGDQKAVLEKPNEGRHSASRARQGVKTMMDVTKQSKMQLDENEDPMKQSDNENLENHELKKNGISHQKKAKPMRGSNKLIRSDTGVVSKCVSSEKVEDSPNSVVQNADMVSNILRDVNMSLKVVKDRAHRKQLLRCKEILGNNVDSKLPMEGNQIGQHPFRDDDSCETDESDSDYEPPQTTHKLKFLSEKQVGELVDMDLNGVPINVIKRRFGLSSDSAVARIDINRIEHRFLNKNSNKREGLKLLAERTAFLVKHLDEVRKVDIHERDIQKIGLQQAICFGIRDFKASSSWVKRVKKMCNLVSRHVDIRMSKLSKDRSLEIEENVSDFKKLVAPYLAKHYPPGKIYNVDQTAINKELVRNRTLTKKGTPKVVRMCQRDNALTHSVTVNIAISASGKLLSKCFITLQERNPPQSFQSMVAPFTELYVTCSKSGKMDTALANEWCEDLFLPEVQDGSVLMLDSWPGFKQMMNLPSAARKKLKFVVFPPKTTSQLQPLDLHFNRQWKAFLKVLEEHIRQQHPSFIIEKRVNFLKILNFAYNQFKAPIYQPMIRVGFEILGILPRSGVNSVTPAQYALNPRVTAGRLCSQCRQFALVRCSYCPVLFCLTCALNHIH